MYRRYIIMNYDVGISLWIHYHALAMGIIKNKTKNFGTPEMLPPPKKQTTWYVALLVDIVKNRDSWLYTYICTYLNQTCILARL